MVVYFNITNHIAIAMSVKNKHNLLYFLNCAALAETLWWTYNINIRTSYMSHHSGHHSEVDLGVLQVKGRGWWRSTNWAAKEWMGFLLDPFVDACSSVLMELSLCFFCSCIVELNVGWGLTVVLSRTCLWCMDRYWRSATAGLTVKRLPVQKTQRKAFYSLSRRGLCLMLSLY